MNAPRAIHPTVEQLAAYALGKLEEADAAAIHQHLETCASCREAAVSIPPDSFVGLVRSAQEPVGVSASTPMPARTQDFTAVRTGPAVNVPAGLPPELAGHSKFRILRELGRGGMGVVYQAEHRLMKRPVAIKVLNQRLLDNPASLARFHQEVEMAAQLEHPNIVTAHDAEQAGDVHLLVMEYVEGQSLAQVLDRQRALPIDQACQFIAQAAAGLAHAHARKMIHRDIKPQNLMLTLQGRVKILDFGLARIAERPHAKGLTLEGALMGTPEYMAPEQATDSRQADIRSDIYSLGCTLYTLLTGHPPFQAETAMQIILAHIEKEAPPLTQLLPEAPVALAAVLAKMMAKKPADRYQTPAEVLTALTPFCQLSPETDIAGDGVAKMQHRRKLTQSRRWVPAMLAVVAALVVGAWLLITNGEPLLGTVVLEIDQPGAQVFVDDSKTSVPNPGDTRSLEIKLDPGQHKLRISKDGFEAVTRDVESKAGKSATIQVRLEPVQAVAARPVEPAKDPAPPAPRPAATVTEEQLRQRIETAWPGLGNRLSRDSGGQYSLHLRMCGQQVADLKPLQGMPLTSLNIAYCGQVKDLTPLQGMNLKSLSIGRCGQIRNLRPLQGMELDFLDLAQCHQLDLKQLQGMKIKHLFLWNCSAANDLRSLQGIRFSALTISYCFPINDLTPLQGMPITELYLDHCERVADLTPLKGMPLTKLNIKGCARIIDLTPLKDTPLQEIDCDFKAERDAKVLRGIKTLDSINGTPEAQFWKETGLKP